MICPKCKNDIMDGAKACPYCGESFLNNQPTRHLSIQQQAAEQELKKYDKAKIRESLILMIIGIIGMIFGIFMKSKSDTMVWLEIGSIILVCVYGNEYLTAKSTKARMERILDDKKRKAICPYCKSPNIKQRFVKGSTTRGKSRTRVSKNINPMHPFSYRNYDTKPVNTSHNYKTTYYCQTCGSVFDNPQIFEYE